LGSEAMLGELEQNSLAAPTEIRAHHQAGLLRRAAKTRHGGG
jgi:hypothetical protein